MGSLSYTTYDTRRSSAMRRLILLLMPLGLSSLVAVWLLIRHSLIAGASVVVVLCLLALSKPPIEPN